MKKTQNGWVQQGVSEKGAWTKGNPAPDPVLLLLLLLLLPVNCRLLLLLNSLGGVIVNSHVFHVEQSSTRILCIGMLALALLSATSRRR